jgi:hypothetical protein
MATNDDGSSTGKVKQRITSAQEKLFILVRAWVASARWHAAGSKRRTARLCLCFNGVAGVSEWLCSSMWHFGEQTQAVAMPVETVLPARPASSLHPTSASCMMLLLLLLPLLLLLSLLS